MDEKEKDTNSEVNEPGTAYNVTGHGSIAIYTSFEAQRDAQRAYWATLTPQQLLLNLKELIKASFGIKDDNIPISQLSKRITIRQHR